jgi:HD-like signal output (HDOD) protein
MQAAQINATEFAIDLREEIAAKRIRLPTLPEVALRVKAAVEGESSAHEIASLVAQDIALSGRLVQVANSPLYRGAAEVDSIQVAVTRLGTKMVKSFVIGLTLRQMFNTSSGVLADAFRKIWRKSIQVAAVSQILAEGLPGIDPEEAMLGGLLYNIGALPILTHLDETHTDNLNAAAIQDLVEQLAPEIGTQILNSWKFSPELVAIPEGCHDLDRDAGPQVDYVDIVCASRLQYMMSEGLIDVTEELSHLSVFEKLGINVEVVVLEDESTAAWASQIQDTLNC